MRASTALIPLALFVAALAVRLLSWPLVIGARHVHFAGADAWYHARRVRYSLDNWPETLGFDSFLSFPHGATAIWPPLFDTALVLWVRALGPWVDLGDPHAVERGLAWAPPLLGALTVVVLYAVARRHLGAGVAIAAGFLLCVLSAHVWTSRIGAVDHHVAVALGSTLLLGAALGLARLLDAEPAAGAVRLGWASSALGAVAALLLLVWPGGLLHVALAWAALLALAATRRERARSRRASSSLAFAAAVGLLVVAIGGDPVDSFAPTVSSHFQPWLFAAMGLHAAACALFWRRLAALGRPPHVRLGESMLLGVAVLVASLALFPDLASGAAEAWRWLGRDEAFQAAVGESKPLFFERGTFDVSLAELRLSRLVYLFPLALVAVALGPWRGPVGLVVVTWSGGLAAATLAQARFFNSFSVAMALVSAAGLVALWRLLPLRSAPSRVAAATLLGLAGLWLLAPSWGAYSRDVSNLRALVQGATLTVPPERRYWMALYETALWLRERTPSPGAAYAPGARPGYGVLGHWQTGHLVTYVAERPMVVGNFGDDLGEESARSFDLALDYFRAPESEAALILDSLGARYVLVRPLDVDRGESSPESIARQLGDSDAGGLSRHRLLYERPVLRAAGAEKPRSHFRIFERVRGAEIVGWAPPGSPVAATLPYTSPTGRKGSFRGEARADSSGRFRLRVAQPTSGERRDFRVGPHFTLAAAGREGAVAVPERAVLMGEEVAGPDLR